ncbi:MAG: pantetheine-phosphate adenylyltransferase [Planctomycetes bacterium]|nr:pantetheine-phosphate adenylyltransferase [Planctomycetota bacterium]
MPAQSARRVAVYAGSFDPATLGHLYMIREGARLFDRLIVAIGDNPAKRYAFSLDERLAALRRCTAALKNVRVETFERRFLVDFARDAGAQYIVRGIRSAGDFEYERTMRHVNHDLAPALTTVFLMPPRELAEISSSFVKGLVGPAGWQSVVKRYLPAPVYKQFLRRFTETNR